MPRQPAPHPRPQTSATRKEGPRPPQNRPGPTPRPNRKTKNLRVARPPQTRVPTHPKVSQSRNAPPPTEHQKGRPQSTPKTAPLSLKDPAKARAWASSCHPACQPPQCRAAPPATAAGLPQRCARHSHRGSLPACAPVQPRCPGRGWCRRGNQPHTPGLEAALP